MRKFFFWAAAMLLNVPAGFAYDNISVAGEFVSLSFKSAAGVAASENKIFVADAGSGRIVMFTRGEKLPALIGSSGSGPRQFSSPEGVAIGRDGRVYVADTGNSRIQVLDAKGAFLYSFGSGGSRDGQLSKPRGIACGPDGNIYVADTGNSRIQVFSPDGIMLYSLTTGIEEPAAVAVDFSGNIYALNGGAQKISKFNTRGIKVDDIRTAASSFCVDSYGFVYAADIKKGKIYEYAPNGSLAGEFGAYGKGPGQFDRPSALAISPSGNLLVTDSGNRRVMEIAVENQSKTAELPPNSDTTIRLAGPENSIKAKFQFFTVLDDESIAGYLPDAKEMVVFDKKGAVKLKFGAYGKLPGQLREPAGMAYSPEKGFIVSDAGNSRVQIFSSTGGFKIALGEKSGKSSKESRLDSPAGLDVSEKGMIFVADSDASKALTFTAEGMFVNALGPKAGGAELDEPVDAKWSPDGQVLVLDRKLKKVFVFSPAGKLIKVWGSAGEGVKQLAEPVSLACDGKGYVYVLDRKFGKVKVFDMDGNWISNYFALGAGRGNLAAPSQIAFRNNRLYIADPRNGTVASYAVNVMVAPPAKVAASAKDGKAALRWQAADSAWVKTYNIFRAPAGSKVFALVGKSTETVYSERLAKAHATYYYQVAAESFTGDAGLPSSAVEIFVPGSRNVSRLEFEKIDLGYIFSANYKYYLKNPVGKIVIANNTDTDFKNIKLSFALKDFMDFPYDTVIESLDARSKREVPLAATLNNKILDVSEDTPVQAQFTLTFYENGQEETQSITRPVKVLSRLAIIWDKSARLANFITPKDPPVFGFGRGALLMKPKLDDSVMNANVKSALIIWSALGEAGLSYMPDPANPYEKVKSNQDFPLDTVQMPRDTLKLKSGECDDLTALLSTLLEGAGVQTALLDYPSHIALMFNTGAAQPEEAGFSSDRLVKYNGTYWVPLEATMIGKSFADAVRQAKCTYEGAGGDAKIISTQEAWAEFEPATLADTPWEAPMPDKAAVVKRYSDDLAALEKQRFDCIRDGLESALKENPGDADKLNDLGVLYAESGDLSAAGEQFGKVLAAEPENAAALNNMGNVSFEKGEMRAAADYYAKAAAADPADANLPLNQARAALKLGDREAAKSFVEQAARIDPDTRAIGDDLLGK